MGAGHSPGGALVRPAYRMLWLATLGTIGAALATCTADIGAQSIAQSRAQHCARTAAATDSEIADCFVREGLPIPGDLL